MPASQIYSSPIIEMTNAQFKALPTTEFIEIVPAPGADKMLRFISGLIRVNTVAGIYENISPFAVAYFRIGEIASCRIMEASLGQVSSWLGTDWDSVVLFPPLVDVNFTDELAVVGPAEAVTSYANQPLQFTMNNPDGVPTNDFTGGNAANSVQISVQYTIIDV